MQSEINSPPLQPPDAPRRRWAKRPGDPDFWPWKWCPSQVWRGLPLCQFWFSLASLFST